MTFYEKELKAMFSSNPVIENPKIAGKTLLGLVDENILVKISFVSTGVSGQYNAMKVKLINRNEGEIDSETFRFEDILGKLRGYHGEKEIPMIGDNDGDPQWCTPLNSFQKEEIADTILDYVSMYQNQDMIM